MSNEHSLLDAIKAIGHDLKEAGVEAVADAASDIRHKMAEEGWPGRQITPGRQAAQPHSLEPASATVAVSEPTPADSDYDKWLTERYNAEPQPQEQAQDREIEG